MQHIARSVILIFSNLIRSHCIPWLLTVFILLIITVWQYCIYNPNFSQIIKTNDLEENEINSSLLKVKEPISQVIQEDRIISYYELNKEKYNETSVNKYKDLVMNNLKYLLGQFNFDTNDINQLILILIANVKLQFLTWKISYNKSYTYDSMTKNLKINNEIQQGDWVNSVLKGTVGGNFISSARDAGLTNSEISAVIKAIQWQMDFRKLKKGDEFAVLMSHEILDGKREQSQLVGVRLRSEGKDYYAIRAEDGKFYDCNGAGFTNGFLRFPTSRRFRVSSNFNSHRINPVTGRVAQHLGVDFAMPQGTPVLSVGDGEVLVAKHSIAAGYYIVVRHGRNYTTRYMHLCKLLVKPGQKVKRGDRIALSGNTGRSTGPHLHYEVWINQQAVNPLTVHLPRTAGLTGKDRTEYLAQVREVMPQLSFD